MVPRFWQGFVDTASESEPRIVLEVSMRSVREEHSGVLTVIFHADDDYLVPDWVYQRNLNIDLVPGTRYRVRMLWEEGWFEGWLVRFGRKATRAMRSEEVDLYRSFEVEW